MGTIRVLMLAAVAMTGGTFSVAASGQVKIGVTLSMTGPAASLGIPERQTVALFPKEIAGQKVEYIVLDDASDPTGAARNMRKLASEDRVDAVIGSTVSPPSLAMVPVAAETLTPMISIAGAARIVEPMDEARAWVFKTPQHDALMSSAIVDAMVKRKQKTLAVIAFNDAYGEGWVQETGRQAEKAGVKVVAVERFARTDTTVVGQVLKVLATRPDAVLIVGAGTPCVLPQKGLREKGYKGAIYQTHGVANNDFLRVGGKDVEGTLLPVGPVLVADQLPASPVKTTALNYMNRFEAAHGKGTVTTFGAHAWDAMLMLSAAIPQAAKKAKPGMPEFRAALRDALENLKDLPVSHGVMNTSAKDHNGLDQRARVMVQIEGGRWKLVQ